MLCGLQSLGNIGKWACIETIVAGFGVTNFENGYSWDTKFGRVTPESSWWIVLRAGSSAPPTPKNGCWIPIIRSSSPAIPRPRARWGRSKWTYDPTGVPRLPAVHHRPQQAGRLLSGCNAGAQDWSHQPYLHPRTANSSLSFILLVFWGGFSFCCCCCCCCFGVFLFLCRP